MVAAATALGVGLLYLPVATRDGYGPAIERAVAEGADALLFQQSPALPTDQRDLVSVPTSIGSPRRIRTGPRSELAD